MDIEYTVQVWKEGNQFIDQAIPLDVVSSGPTPEDAKKALGEAISVFLATTAKEMHTLEDILAECGYEYDGEKWPSPPWIAFERQSQTIGT